MILKAEICVLLFVIVAASNAEVSVTIKLGTINGYKQNINGNDVSAFLSIPYAVPPIGDLRFRKPLPITEKWNEPLNARNLPKICMQESLMLQPHEETSEDCLYLNVWTPVKLDEDFSQNLRTVMVFIHGGAFTYMGISNKYYNGSVLSSFGDVVVVTMNYRLGAFGFLATDNNDAPGNVGLYDQALALEWVNDNIAYFGGDPNSITVFGESGGAMSVTLHILSPISQNLINRAILMSGAVFRGVAVESKEVAIKKSFKLASLLGCDQEQGMHDTETTLRCLRTIDAQTLSKAQESPELIPLSHMLAKVWFSPVYGEEFLPHKPSVALEQHLFNLGVDILVGTCTNEGAILHYFFHKWGFSTKTESWYERFRLYLDQYFVHLTEEEKARIASNYFYNIENKSSTEAEMAYYAAIGDLYFQCESYYFTEIYSKVNQVYQYLFDYPLKNENDLMVPCSNQSACHLNDVPIAFGMVSDPSDVEASEKWMQIFVTFAKTATAHWPKHSNGYRPYFHFKGHELSNKIRENFRAEECESWTPALNKHY